MATCGALVAVAAVPIGFASWVISGRKPLLLRAAKWSVPWGGFEVLLAFLLSSLIPSAVLVQLLSVSGFFTAVYGPEASPDSWEPMRPMWASVFFAPVFLGSAWIVARLAWPAWKPAPLEPARRTAAAIATWIVLHPVVAAIHFAVAAAFVSQGWQPDSHPLETKFQGEHPAVDDVLFVLQAAVAAPLVEEFLFRGVLLPWLLARRHRPRIAMGFAVLLTVAFSVQPDETVRIGPLIFLGVLIAFGIGLHFKLKHHRRTAAAVFSSSALFAMVHTSVWPSPIPLFVLALGLGWLAIRTRGFLAPTIVHGVFNLVSVLFLLRG
jgi:membrane protease YdiL (CAAX protease family)